MSGPDDATTLYREQADRLFGLAYRILGEVGEAQDAVQDAFVRWSQADRSDVREPAAWLTTTTTRLCLDRLTSARHRRETYVGPWLPEPLLTADLDPAELAATADSLTFAFLVVLESLSPIERVVFVLHDVFGHPHAEIAAMLDRDPAAIRQAGSRARRHVEQRRPRYDADRARRRAVTEAFLDACANGDLDRMLALLAPDVTLVGDGGGKASALPAPVHGAERVAQILVGFWRTGTRNGSRITLTEVNAEPAIVAVDPEGQLESVLVIEVADGRVRALRGVRNPDKLAALGRQAPGA